MQLITLDFESFYSDDFSLSSKKLTTEAYVRSPLFETIGVGIKFGNSKSRWFPKPLVAKALSMINWDDAMVLCHNMAFDGLILSHHYGIKPKMLLDTMMMAKPFHHANTGVGLAKLTAHYNCGVKGTEVVEAKGKRYADFSPEELAAYGGYCCNDCDITYALLNHLMPRFIAGELRFIDKVIRTFTEPSLFWHEELLRIHLDDVIARKQAMLKRIALIATPVELSSNGKFIAILEKFGGRWPRSMLASDEAYDSYMQTMETQPGAKPYLFDIPTKEREATATEQAKKGMSGMVTVWALAKKDEEFLALQEIDDEELQAVIAARLGTKSTIAETRAARMLEASSRGAFPIALLYYAAHTGRLGGYESSNPQNFPKAKAITPVDVGFMIMSPDGPVRLNAIVGDTVHTPHSTYPIRACTTICIRHCLIPPKGKKLVVADASQIELRTGAWEAGQDDLVQVFAEGRDPYSEFATTVYGYEVTKKLPVERFVGKTCQLGLLFSTGHVKLQSTLAIGQGDIHVIIPLEESQRIVNTYRKVKYPKIPAFWKTCGEALKACAEGREMFFGPDNLFRTSQDTIWLPNGMPITYTGLKWVVEENGEKGFKYWGKKEGRYQWVRIYPGKVFENCTQSLARIMVSDAWVRIAQRYTVAMQVHDELVCVVDENEADECLEFMIKEMSVAPSWAKGLPLAAEGDTGYSYASCK